MSVFVPSGVLFDMDGTITTIRPSYQAMCSVFRRCSLSRPSFAEYVEHFNFPYEEFYHSRGVTLKKTEISQIYNSCQPHTTAEIFPDAFTTTAHFSGLGIRLGVVSANDIKLVQYNCRRARIDAHLDYVVGNVNNKVPAILEFCQGNRLEPSEVIFVGDFPTDMRDAGEAGVVGVGITHGEEVGHILWSAGAVHVIDNLFDLTKLPILESKILV